MSWEAKAEGAAPIASASMTAVANNRCRAIAIPLQRAPPNHDSPIDNHSLEIVAIYGIVMPRSGWRRHELPLLRGRDQGRGARLQALRARSVPVRAAPEAGLGAGQARGRARSRHRRPAGLRLPAAHRNRE